MKITRIQKPTAGERLRHWCATPSSPYTLVVASECGCDLSRIERQVCDRLNNACHPSIPAFECFDCEDIRQIAGDAKAREFLARQANLPGDHRFNDYETVLRALASLGGVVLCGSGSLDVAADFSNVCSAMITREDPPVAVVIDPDLYAGEEVITAIAGRFLLWLTDPKRANAAQQAKLGVPAELLPA